jgi:hypothetical protein
MLAKLTRILLGFCTAFVFTGQMEAAAEHCARLALAAEHETHAASQHHTGHHQQAETPDCHDAAPAAEATHQSSQTKAPAGHCECIAALKMCAALPAAEASHPITPYAWLTAATHSFASTQPAPDLRPPRA